jgi:vacuolar-type H+-ATPase subunit E/Vma4
MNDFDGVLGRQVQSLTEVLRRQQEMRCREIVAAAEHRADQAIRDSRRKLFERQRQAVTIERQRRQHELLIAQSRVESQVRQRAYAEYTQVLDAARPRLVEALDARWADTDGRRNWCEMIVREATATLAPGNWTVEHPTGFSSKDRDTVSAILDACGVNAPTFHADEDISAGLRIRVGSACLDGTAAGLLVDQHAVEALVLACWEAAGG